VGCLRRFAPGVSQFRDAVASALTYLEGNVLFTRKGHAGVRHLPGRGMVAARFVHRDSRAGDPDLHTHVAVANKVQTEAGEWMAIDATVLYAAKVTLSEVYTASLVARLRNLGLVMVPTGRDQRLAWTAEATALLAATPGAFPTRPGRRCVPAWAPDRPTSGPRPSPGIATG
jgi:hypothetical protein